MLDRDFITAYQRLDFTPSWVKFLQKSFWSFSIFVLLIIIIVELTNG